MHMFCSVCRVLFKSSTYCSFINSNILAICQIINDSQKYTGVEDLAFNDLKYIVDDIKNSGS